jgi:5-methylcytosine-specific restriction endonuclease McrA
MMAKVKNPRVPRTRGNNTMTEAGFWSFIRSGLRSKSQRWPPKYAAKAAAKKSVTGKRHRFEYQCAKCTKWFKDKEVEVNHIIPCGTLKSFDDLPVFVERLFCEQEHLEVICKPCHKLETAEQRKGK